MVVLGGLATSYERGTPVQGPLLSGLGTFKTSMFRFGTWLQVQGYLTYKREVPL